MGRRQVLELVDEEHPAPSPGLAACERIRQEDLDRAIYLLVEVNLAAVGKEAAVAFEYLGEAIHVAPKVGLHFLRVPQTEPDRGKSVQPCGRRIGVGAPWQVDEAVQHGTDLALLDRGHVRAPAEEREAERVEGTNLQLR